jgi:pullulanase/glycogen debranching enzyme
VNSHWDSLTFQVPQASNGGLWKVVVNTSMPAPEDIYDACCGPSIHDSKNVIVGGRSVMVLTAGQKGV